MPTTWFRLFWLTWALVGLAVEVYAVWFNKASGDTATEQLRPLLSHPLAWWLAAGFVVWAVLHLFFGRA